MPVEKIIVTLLAGYLAGALVNYIADVLPLFYDKTFSKKPNTFQNYFFPFKFGSNKWVIISKRRLILQALFPLVSIALLFNPTSNIHITWLILLLVVFVLISVIDIEHYYILLPTIVLGYVIAGIIGIKVNGISASVTGLSVGFLSMLAFYYLGKVYIIIRYKISPNDTQGQNKIPLGFGDVNLGGIIGLLLGWPGVIAGLTLALLAAGTISGLMILMMVIRKEYQPFLVIPYAPFILGVGALLFLF